MVSLYTSKQDKCTRCRDISLLGVVGKVHGKVLVQRIKEGTEGVICGKQGGFKRGRGCVDQILAETGM